MTGARQLNVAVDEQLHRVESGSARAAGRRHVAENALVATGLESARLIRAHAKQVDSCQPGDIVTFRQPRKGAPASRQRYRADAVTAQTGSGRRCLPGRLPLPTLVSQIGHVSKFFSSRLVTCREHCSRPCHWCYN